ncbi:transposase [Nocardia sp. SYP-A9097]|uniref:transposase n=1 Tax=Nocardia sp. SYP-A9097 TaxID=2663237 RepID=UPI00129B8DCB|nr:transposase [Nocardia sp. SYP-A9097]MRH91449.1 transposase [Nocardia sp. SYP-A9097]
MPLTLVAGLEEAGVVAKSYRPVVRDQQFLLAPDMREWLEADHLVWQLLDIVAELDTSEFHRRSSRRRTVNSVAGQRGYDPDMLVTLLLYAYCVGLRSSRAIEKACRTDIAYRVVCANDIPDHTVIARFRAEYEEAFTALFSRVLGLCARAGMVKVGVVALDGTKIAANASMAANRTEATLRRMAEQAAGDIVAEAKATDEAEDRAADGDGDRTPESMRGARRRETIREALASIEAERAERPSKEMRYSQRRLDAAQRAYDQLHEKLTTGWKAEQALLAEGGKLSGRPRSAPRDNKQIQVFATRLETAKAAMAAKLAKEPVKKRNLTDVESRIMKTRKGFIQGYNAQLFVSEDHVIIACELTDEPADTHQFAPMINACTTELDTLAAAGHPRTTGIATADNGYCSAANIDPETTPGPDRLIAVVKDRHQRSDNPGNGPCTYTKPVFTTMAERLKTPAGQAIYRRRGAIVEPVNGHIKDRRGLSRFSRRGLKACAAELKLAATATNILRYLTHNSTQTVPATA